MSDVQKDLKDVFAGIDIFKKIINKFSCYLRSKSARSILTSPGLIRDRKVQSGKSSVPLDKL
jgi:hypothetical protein